MLRKKNNFQLPAEGAAEKISRSLTIFLKRVIFCALIKISLYVIKRYMRANRVLLEKIFSTFFPERKFFNFVAIGGDGCRSAF